MFLMLGSILKQRYFWTAIRCGCFKSPQPKLLQIYLARTNQLILDTIPIKYFEIHRGLLKTGSADPNRHITKLELQNPSQDIPELHKIRRPSEAFTSGPAKHMSDKTKKFGRDACMPCVPIDPLIWASFDRLVSLDTSKNTRPVLSQAVILAQQFICSSMYNSEFDLPCKHLLIANPSLFIRSSESVIHFLMFRRIRSAE